MNKLLIAFVTLIIFAQSFVGYYGWGKYMGEKAKCEQLSARLEDVQSTCREYEKEIVELYKKLGR